MDKIFSRCSLVIVWLGPSCTDTIIAIDHIRKLGTSPFQRRSHSKALLTLLTRPYWKRMWVIQEILLAEDIIFLCGDDSFVWYDLCKTLQRHRLAIALNDQCSCWNRRWHQELGQSPGCRIVDARVQYVSTTQARSLRFAGDQLASLLRDWADQECSDPRDKVYALLGLLVPQRSSSHRPYLRADYQKTKEKLYCDILYLLLDGFTTSNERWVFCVGLLKSLGISPYDPTIREALIKLKPLFKGGRAFSGLNSLPGYNGWGLMECPG